ncbi:RpiB/LacA/LacB family sugar-phosphate isomerase [Paenibacillus sp. CGMCC 1.16610]|uniref:RpiB/LacA/LacB family sugar-phosphate isomerase n=1 Tax=Paenibacillus anseongense TaxID=2682845 RepID=A0ABW9UCE2_9BACL|nr:MULTISPECIES: RpiB/LacA/LacB family sugar-phosphate isomerase [Paenibacillus]MBA2940328.1 RpiB/LacA/LacB family sugar-phosphate isomerase [Paenibacillus sp. CGMCC 1.16610]MVQ35505.1 RpiB/LacA/LacB family sugar-phosphate isomerase [Paenibacillus anseongense]
MKIALGSDHCGYELKVALKPLFAKLGVEVTDFGCHSVEPVDFPDVARTVCNAVRGGEFQRGIMVCGTGVGAAIAANKIPGIRASVCHDIHSAHQCVEHDDVNIMCLGAQIIGPWLAEDLVRSFLQAEFRTDEHFRRRVNKLHILELEGARELMNGK